MKKVLLAVLVFFLLLAVAPGPTSEIAHQASLVARSAVCQ